MPSPSEAAQIIITVIPIVGIVAAAVVLFLYLILQHKQISKMIEKGVYERKRFDIVAFSLLSGLLLLFIGVSLTTFFIVAEGATYSLLGGIIPLSLGLSFFVYYLMRGGKRP